jgi:hypothetical protein
MKAYKTVRATRAWRERKPNVSAKVEPEFAPDLELIKEIIRVGIRALAKECHPDVGGDVKRFIKLQQMKEYLMFFHDCYQESPNDN